MSAGEAVGDAGTYQQVGQGQGGEQADRGQGQLDVVTFFEQALLAGYTGNLSLEIFNDVFRETPNRRTALDAMRSLLFLESECKNRLMARTQAASGEARAPAATRARHRLGIWMNESTSVEVAELLEALARDHRT